MKFHTLALAAALAFSGAAFAAPKNTAMAPVSPDTTHVVKVKPHATRHAVRHQHKAVRHVAAKHHKSVHQARQHAMHERSASVRTDVNGGSRDARMDEALQKFRSSHG
jgi:Spy/CpxP family protein refolding chaperone